MLGVTTKCTYIPLFVAPEHSGMGRCLYDLFIGVPIGQVGNVHSHCAAESVKVTAVLSLPTKRVVAMLLSSCLLFAHKIPKHVEGCMGAPRFGALWGCELMARGSGHAEAALRGSADCMSIEHLSNTLSEATYVITHYFASFIQISISPSSKTKSAVS